MKKLLLATALVSIAFPTLANTIDGSFILYGNAYPDAGTIEFINNSPTLPPNEYGGFVALGVETNNGNFLDLSWRNLNTDISLANLTAGSNLGCGAGCLVMFGNSQNGGGGWFNVSTVDLTPIPGMPDVVAHGYGVMTCAGTFVCDPTYGAWGLSMTAVDSPLAPTGWWQAFGFTAAPTPVPAPVLGTGIPGLLAMALVWLAARRKRAA